MLVLPFWELGLQKLMVDASFDLPRNGETLLCCFVLSGACYGQFEAHRECFERRSTDGPCRVYYCHRRLGIEKIFHAREVLY